MRFITRDMESRMQFFGIAFEGMNLQQLIEEWGNSEHPLDVHKAFYEGIEYKKDDMLRLLPEDIKNKIFNMDGSVKRGILNEELYQEMVNYKSNFNEEWNNACQNVRNEEKRIYPKLPKSVKRITKLHMHDENVSQIYSRNNNELVIELEQYRWGKVSLVFKGVEKAVICNEFYPAWWLYNELFDLENGKYEYNVLFREGEISIVFEDFEVITQTKKYLAEIIADFSPNAVNAKIDELRKQSTERDGCPPPEETISNLRNIMYDDFGLCQAVSNCIYYKKLFAENKSLSRIERDVILFFEVVSDLLFDSISPKLGERKGGVQNLQDYTKAKLDRIINLLSKTGPEFLYQIVMKAEKIFDDKDEENNVRNIKRLNSEIKRNYNRSATGVNEVFSSLVNYLKKNEDKF